MNKNQHISIFLFGPQVYDVQDGPVPTDPISIIRLVIGGRRTENFDIKQCEGLSKILGSYALPMVPEGQRHWSDGTMYLYLIGIRSQGVVWKPYNHQSSLHYDTIHN